MRWQGGEATCLLSAVSGQGCHGHPPNTSTNLPAPIAGPPPTHPHPPFHPHPRCGFSTPVPVPCFWLTTSAAHSRLAPLLPFRLPLSAAFPAAPLGCPSLPSFPAVPSQPAPPQPAPAPQVGQHCMEQAWDGLHQIALLATLGNATAVAQANDAAQAIINCGVVPNRTGPIPPSPAPPPPPALGPAPALAPAPAAAPKGATTPPTRAATSVVTASTSTSGAAALSASAARLAAPLALLLAVCLLV